MTLVGHAVINDDVAAKIANWRPETYRWLPGSAEDPNVVYVDFTTDRIELWSSSHGVEPDPIKGLWAAVLVRDASGWRQQTTFPRSTATVVVGRDPNPRFNSWMLGGDSTLGVRGTTTWGDAPDVVTAARKLGPQIRAARDETEALRRTPSAIVSAMADAGLYQMFLPRSPGGPELPPLTTFAVIEELSRADGSIGWCAMIGSGNALLTGWLPLETVQAMAGVPADLRLAGSLRPQGRAWPVGGGYKSVDNGDSPAALTMRSGFCVPAC